MCIRDKHMSFFGLFCNIITFELNFFIEIRQSYLEAVANFLVLYPLSHISSFSIVNILSLLPIHFFLPNCFLSSINSISRLDHNCIDL